jgi:hypothetical protein
VEVKEIIALFFSLFFTGMVYLQRLSRGAKDLIKRPLCYGDTLLGVVKQ